MSAAEAKADKYPPLDEATRERLGTLLDEVVDMKLALGRLIDADGANEIPAAVDVLFRAMGNRLVKAVNIVSTGNEEG